MGLADIVRAGIAVANTVTGDLKADVLHYPWTGMDAYGKPTYGGPVTRKAIVDFRQRYVRQVDGHEVVQVAKVTFLTPIAENGASGRREPIDPRDKIVLPNGYQGPILDVSGFVDSSTDQPFAIEVSLG